jgi:hypothetical protein
MLVVASACYWRAERMRGAAAKLNQQQMELVRSALPGQKLTSAVLARLKSEHAKLSGSRATNNAVRLPTSVLPVMRQVIDSLPADVSILVHELRLEGDEIYVDVELAAFQEAGLLAQALQASGLSMSPPSTSIIKGGKIRAQLRGTQAPRPSPTLGSSS